MLRLSSSSSMKEREKKEGCGCADEDEQNKKEESPRMKMKANQKENDEETNAVFFHEEEEEDFTVLEIGCGVGNTVLPLLELDPIIDLSDERESGNNNDNNNNSNSIKKAKKKRLIVWGVDFSSVAIDILRQDPRYFSAASDSPPRAYSAVWDITSSSLSSIDPIGTFDSNNDFITLQAIGDISILLFCLSAISPGEKMRQAARNVANTLKPGGVLLVRDYGRYDAAQMRLGTKPCKKVTDNFYVKHDGTRCYYFHLDDLRALFGNGNNGNENETYNYPHGSKDQILNDVNNTTTTNQSPGAGLEILELKYIRRTYGNRAENKERRRVWVQGRFRKPP
mmetsp:Transcript_4892/g.7043  ORF Transcript_4892/g.7043 Transcript_4892/m.7043 type:complete len:338 (-) Transcript_4892:151-1164(-)